MASHRIPNFPPKDAPRCILCADSGLHRHIGEWAFCLCPAGIERRAADPGLADESNAMLRSLEKRTGGR
jgi:hypothetical protein